jgi:SAM-dependent methyltransferase
MERVEYALMDEAEHQLWWYRALHVRLVAALGYREGRVLDAGCGTGGLLSVLAAARPGLALVGLEWSEFAAARAAAKSPALIVRGSVNALPFAPASFDAAITADVLCHAAVDRAQALAELRRVLRRGARLVVNMPAYQWLFSAHDRQVHNALRQTAGQTAQMLRAAGFTGIRTRYWNSLLLPLMIAQRKLRGRGAASSDVAPIPPWLDASLHAVTDVERRLRLALPFGGSVLATAENP